MIGQCVQKAPAQDSQNQGNKEGLPDLDQGQRNGRDDQAIRYTGQARGINSGEGRIWRITQDFDPADRLLFIYDYS